MNTPVQSDPTRCDEAEPAEAESTLRPVQPDPTRRDEAEPAEAESTLRPVQPDPTRRDEAEPAEAESTLRRGGSLEPRRLPELVEEASDESFPASDPPAWVPLVAP